MRSALFLTGLLAVALPCAARAGEPSSACRDGAATCHDAWSKLDACRQAHPGENDSCAAEKSAADEACRADASACDQDGSRSPPARASRG